MIDPSRVIVFKIPTARGRSKDPSYKLDSIAQEYERDHANAAAEYDVVPRSNVVGYADDELADSLARREPREIPYRSHDAAGVAIHYLAGLDVSGGRRDRTACAVAAWMNGRAVLLAVRAWASPHDPVRVAGEVAAFLATYKITSAIADQYGAEVVRSIYANAGVSLLDAPDSRSDTYLALLPQMTSGRIELAPDPLLRQELLGLERRVGRGRDIVDHRPGGTDDAINAAALALVAASRASEQPFDIRALSVQPSTLLDGLPAEMRHSRGVAGYHD